jgi:hypothetical protein
MPGAADAVSALEVVHEILEESFHAVLLQGRTSILSPVFSGETSSSFAAAKPPETFSDP